MDKCADAVACFARQMLGGKSMMNLAKIFAIAVACLAVADVAAPRRRRDEVMIFMVGENVIL